MSTYEGRFDEEKIICPYCGHSHRPLDAGDFGEDDEVDECENCGKQYHVYQEIQIQHRTKPDCELNKQEHEYEDKPLYGGKTFQACAACGKIKT